MRKEKMWLYRADPTVPLQPAQQISHIELDFCDFLSTDVKVNFLLLKFSYIYDWVCDFPNGPNLNPNGLKDAFLLLVSFVFQKKSFIKFLKTYLAHKTTIVLKLGGRGHVLQNACSENESAQCLLLYALFKRTCQSVCHACM